MIRMFLTAAAVLALTGAAGVQAQTALEVVSEPASEPVAEAAPMDEAALEAQADIFDGHLDQAMREIEAAVQAGGDDHAAIMTSVDDILTRLRPRVDAFADALSAFFDHQLAQSGDDPNARSRVEASRNISTSVIRTIPDQIRAEVEHSLTQPEAPPSGEPAANP